MPQRKVPLKAKLLVKAWEGCKLKAYQDDAEKWTIGYGWTHGVYPTTVWTQAQAEANLEMQLQLLCDEVVQFLRPDTTDDQLAAFLSFAWNVGLAGFKSSDARRAHNSGDPRGVLKSFLSWTTITIKGQRVKNYRGLVRRRTADWRMYSEGEVTYP